MEAWAGFVFATLWQRKKDWESEKNHVKTVVKPSVEITFQTKFKEGGIVKGHIKVKTNMSSALISSKSAQLNQQVSDKKLSGVSEWFKGGGE